jgi:hypothetical protein
LARGALLRPPLASPLVAVILLAPTAYAPDRKELSAAMAAFFFAAVPRFPFGLRCGFQLSEQLFEHAHGSLR